MGVVCEAIRESSTITSLLIPTEIMRKLLISAVSHFKIERYGVRSHWVSHFKIGGGVGNLGSPLGILL